MDKLNSTSQLAKVYLLSNQSCCRTELLDSQVGTFFNKGAETGLAQAYMLLGVSKTNNA